MFYLGENIINRNDIRTIPSFFFFSIDDGKMRGANREREREKERKRERIEKLSLKIKESLSC